MEEMAQMVPDPHGLPFIPFVVTEFSNCEECNVRIPIEGQVEGQIEGRCIECSAGTLLNALEYEELAPRAQMQLQDKLFDLIVRSYPSFVWTHFEKECTKDVQHAVRAWCARKIGQNLHEHRRMAGWNDAEPKDIRSFVQVDGHATVEQGMMMLGLHVERTLFPQWLHFWRDIFFSEPGVIQETTMRWLDFVLCRLESLPLLPLDKCPVLPPLVQYWARSAEEKQSVCGQSTLHRLTASVLSWKDQPVVEALVDEKMKAFFQHAMSLFSVLGTRLIDTHIVRSKQLYLNSPDAEDWEREDAWEETLMDTEDGIFGHERATSMTNLNLLLRPAFERTGVLAEANPEERRLLNMMKARFEKEERAL
mmetsp:Transcript_18074/g.44950  ORF Transcript_18074/g.44950 Transcript_18074/m.44950 type:complete len:364 (-) Transcript_18074:3807-4898(-)